MSSLKQDYPEITLKVELKGDRSKLVQIKQSNDVYLFAKEIFDESEILWREEMVMLCMNASNSVIGWYKVSSGGINKTLCDSRIVFTVALNCPGTCSIILIHNHPSGSLKPSQQDVLLSQKIKKGGEILDIAMLDSLIISDRGYYSLADNSDI